MPRTLYHTVTSPYARKVRIVLLEKQLEFVAESVDLGARPSALLAISPLGKIPALLDDDGTAVFDSTVIVEYLEDRYPDPPMLGHTWSERLAQRALEELGDTIADEAVALMRANRAGEPLAIERSKAALDRALVALSERFLAGKLPPFGSGTAAVIAALGYVELRHGRSSFERFATIIEWQRVHAERPSVLTSAGG